MPLRAMHNMKRQTSAAAHDARHGTAEKQSIGIDHATASEHGVGTLSRPAVGVARR